jgi:putative MATE family efflux protein
LDKAVQNEYDFSKGSIPKSILRLTVPMAAAQLMNILYNLIDRMYIGRLPDVGRLALTGVGVTLPIITILTGFANLCGMGGSPLASMARGKGDIDDAEHTMGNAFTLLVIFGVVLTVVGMIIKKPLLYFLGASENTFDYANDYMTIYLCGTMFVMISLGLNPFINCQGFGRTGMMTIALGAVINILLDPLFIFAFNMGVQGAALATIFSQFCSMIWVLKFLTGKKALLHLRIKNFRLKLKTVIDILALGVSNFVMSFTTSLVQMMANSTLQTLGGDLYVSVMTVINSIREIAFIPVNSLTNGATPIISFNYGAREYARIRKAIRFTFTLAMASAAFMWLVIQLFPKLFIQIFNSDPELIATGVPAFHIYFAAYIFMAFQMTGQVTFLSIGRAKAAIFFSLLRKAFIVVPLILLLPTTFGLGTTGVFLSEPISDIVGGCSCFITMILVVYRPLGKLANGDTTVKLPGRQN